MPLVGPRRPQPGGDAAGPLEHRPTPHRRSPYATVTVRKRRFTLVARRAQDRPGGDVQTTVDQILGANHLTSSTLDVGQKLRIPE